MLKSLVRYPASVLVLALAWQGVVLFFGLPPYVLPGPVEVMRTLFRELPWFLEHAGATLVNMLAGASIGILLGILVGFLAAYSRLLMAVIEPQLVILQSFPREALIPVIVVWLGFGHAPKIVNAALLSFFPMALITMNALLDTRWEYLELVRSWGTSRRKEFLYCRLPCAMQSIAAVSK